MSWSRQIRASQCLAPCSTMRMTDKLIALVTGPFPPSVLHYTETWKQISFGYNAHAFSHVWRRKSTWLRRWNKVVRDLPESQRSECIFDRWWRCCHWTTRWPPCRPGPQRQKGEEEWGEVIMMTCRSALIITHTHTHCTTLCNMHYTSQLLECVKQCMTAYLGTQWFWECKWWTGQHFSTYLHFL